MLLISLQEEERARQRHTRKMAMYNEGGEDWNYAAISQELRKAPKAKTRFARLLP